VKPRYTVACRGEACRRRTINARGLCDVCIRAGNKATALKPRAKAHLSERGIQRLLAAGGPGVPRFPGYRVDFDGAAWWLLLAEVDGHAAAIAKVGSEQEAERMVRSGHAA
jgi:hypothetical protein